MQVHQHQGIWVVLLTLMFLAARGCSQEDSSSKLDRLERLVLEQQAQMEHGRQQWQKERDLLRQDIQDLKAAGHTHEREARSSEDPGDDRQTENWAHARWARSDDGGPLEVVVNRLAQDFAQLSGNVQALSGNVQTLKTLDAARGSRFVRWGSSTCPSSTQLVYSGVVGGSFWTHTGAAANALCLTMSPRPHAIPSGVNLFAELYGGEYETQDSHFEEDPLCAVCWSPLSTSLMVPGTDQCPGGWTPQYAGFLLAGRTTHAAASQYICVDRQLESRPGSNADTNGYVLYYVRSMCGSLPCPPYHKDTVVTCVVCSK